MIEIKISKSLRHTYGDSNTQVSWQWCIDNFGLPGQQPSGYRWQYDTQRTFYFTDQADATLFALKWL